MWENERATTMEATETFQIQLQKRHYHFCHILLVRQINPDTVLEETHKGVATKCQRSLGVISKSGYYNNLKNVWFSHTLDGSQKWAFCMKTIQSWLIWLEVNIDVVDQWNKCMLLNPDKCTEYGVRTCRLDVCISFPSLQWLNKQFFLKKSECVQVVRRAAHRFLHMEEKLSALKPLGSHLVTDILSHKSWKCHFKCLSFSRTASWMVHRDRAERGKLSYNVKTERDELSYNVKGTPLEKSSYYYYPYGTEGLSNLPSITKLSIKHHIQPGKAYEALSF